MHHFEVQLLNTLAGGATAKKASSQSSPAGMMMIPVTASDRTDPFAAVADASSAAGLEAFLKTAQVPLLVGEIVSLIQEQLGEFDRGAVPGDAAALRVALRDLVRHVCGRVNDTTDIVDCFVPAAQVFAKSLRQTTVVPPQETSLPWVEDVVTKADDAYRWLAKRSEREKQRGATKRSAEKKWTSKEKKECKSKWTSYAKTLRSATNANATAWTPSPLRDVFLLQSTNSPTTTTTTTTAGVSSGANGEYFGVARLIVLLSCYLGGLPGGCIVEASVLHEWRHKRTNQQEELSLAKILQACVKHRHEFPERFDAVVLVLLVLNAIRRSFVQPIEDAAKRALQLLERQECAASSDGATVALRLLEDSKHTWEFFCKAVLRTTLFSFHVRTSTPVEENFIQCLVDCLAITIPTTVAPSSPPPPSTGQTATCPPPEVPPESRASAPHHSDPTALSPAHTIGDPTLSLGKEEDDRSSSLARHVSLTGRDVSDGYGDADDEIEKRSQAAGADRSLLSLGAGIGGGVAARSSMESDAGESIIAVLPHGITVPLEESNASSLLPPPISAQEMQSNLIDHSPAAARSASKGSMGVVSAQSSAAAPTSRESALQRLQRLKHQFALEGGLLHEDVGGIRPDQRLQPPPPYSPQSPAFHEDPARVRSPSSKLNFVHQRAAAEYSGPPPVRPVMVDASVPAPLAEDDDVAPRPTTFVSPQKKESTPSNTAAVRDLAISYLEATKQIADLKGHIQRLEEQLLESHGQQERVAADAAAARFATHDTALRFVELERALLRHDQELRVVASRVDGCVYNLETAIREERGTRTDVDVLTRRVALMSC